MSRPAWVPDRAEYFTIQRTYGGRGLAIEFYRPQDVTAELLPVLRNVAELPGLLRKVDQAANEGDRATRRAIQKARRLIDDIEESLGHA